MNELEIICHNRVAGMSVFLDTVDYRTPHFHPEWELLWMLDDPMLVNCGGRQITARKGDLLLFQPDEPHEFRKESEEATFLCLQVSSDMLHLTEEPTTGVLRLNDALDTAEVHRLCRMLLDTANAYYSGESCSALNCLGQTYLIFYALLTQIPMRSVTQEEKLSRERRNSRLASLLKFVDENYMHKVRLSDYAEAEGFSLSYLSHFIKSALNQSFQEYVNSVRVNCACKLIAAGEEKLTAVCLSSGFSDYRYFSAAFKKQFGMTPEQYKLSVKKPENAVIHHSIHSLERFYTDEQTRVFLAELKGKIEES